MKKILIVDDSKVSRNIIKKILKELGYKNFIEATDGIEGLKAFKENQNNLELIISDIEMPNLDGIKMINMIKKIEPEISVIIVTSIVNSNVILEVINIKCVTINKPIDIETLKKAINDVK